MTALAVAPDTSGGTHPLDGVSPDAAVITEAYLSGRLATLIAGFGLHAQRAAIRDSFDAIFRQGVLGFPLGTRSPRPSRLTEDGTPIQFATMIGRPGQALRLVGDPAPPACTGRERLLASIDAMAELAGVLGVSPELDALRPLLAALAPEGNRTLLADPAGALWLGAAFAAAAPARMRVYFNGSWGSGADRLGRMHGFVAHFGHAETWRRTEACLPKSLEPLGMALTLAPGRAPRAALYFRAFGLRLDDYVTLALRVGGPVNAASIAAFGAALLGDEADFPAGSAVLSFGFGSGSGLTVDLEFCAHCLFRDDAHARSRLLQVFRAAGTNPEPYLRMAECLRNGAGQGRPPRIHSFVGIDGKSPTPAFSLYMKPDLARHG